jgi:hypothetical protein
MASSFRYYEMKSCLPLVKDLQNICMQVSQCKFIFWRGMWKYNLREFLGFFPWCLNPFKIQTRFKLDLLQNFIIQNMERFGSWTKEDNCSIWISISAWKVWRIFSNRKIRLCIFELGAFDVNWKIRWLKGKETVWGQPTWPTQPEATPTHLTIPPQHQHTCACARSILTARLRLPTARWGHRVPLQ